MAKATQSVAECAVSSSIDQRLVCSMTFVSIALISLLALPLLTGRVPVTGDLGNFHLPLSKFYAQCLASGDSLAWMPDRFSGSFMVGEGQFGAYHPLHWLTYRALPFDTAFALEVFLPCPLMLIGMGLFLRRHVGGAGALMGAMLYTFSIGFMHYRRHPVFAATLALIPWLLWSMDVAVASSGRKRRFACVMIALLTGSQFLLLYAQALSFSLVTVFGYSVYLFLHHRPSRAAWAAIVVGNALGALLGSVQVLPTLAAIDDSVRSHVTLDWIMVFSIHPSKLVGIVSPHLHFSQGGPYFGVIPLVLISWWVAARLGREVASSQGTGLRGENGPAASVAGTRLAYGALAFSIATLVMALGRYGGLYYLHTYLPVIGNLRAPARYTTLTQLGLAVASAVAFAHLVMWVKRHSNAVKGQDGTDRATSDARATGGIWSNSNKSLTLPWTIATVSILTSLGFALFGDVRATGDLRGHWYAGPLLVVLAATALTCAVRGRRIGLYMLVAIAMIDTGLYGISARAVDSTWRTTPKYDQWVATYPEPPERSNHRVYIEGAHANRATLQGHRLASKYVALTPAKQLDYHDANALRVAGVDWFHLGWLRRKNDLTHAVVHGLGAPEQQGWRRVPGTLPRVRLVNDAQTSNSPGEDLKRIDVERTALVTEPMNLSSPSPGEATIVGDRPGEIRVRVQPNGRELLVVSESYHAGWSARIDGLPAKVHRVNGDFLGCVVESGQRVVEFEFRPQSLVWGKRISLMGLALTLGVVVLAALPSRRLLGPPPDAAPADST